MHSLGAHWTWTKTNQAKPASCCTASAGSNSHGQLGAGMSISTEYSLKEPASYVPVEVAGGHSFKAISSGAAFTCGVTLQNAALCWGVSKGA